MDTNTVDAALALYLPRWRNNGYEVLIIADHGQTERGQHGGSETVMREVPLYYFGSSDAVAESEVLDQLQIAPSVLTRLGATVPASMHAATFLQQ